MRLLFLWVNPLIPNGIGDTQYPYIYFTQNDSVSKISLDVSVLDTLNSLIQLEITDLNYWKNKEIRNEFSIDTAEINKYSKNLLEPGYNDDIFYLLLNEGRDTLLVNLMPNEGEGKEFLMGEIKAYNSYVLRFLSMYYQQTHLVNKTTGEKIPFTEGIPIVSPLNEFIADIVEAYDFERDECYGTIMTITKANDSLELKRKWSVVFHSFLPDDTFTPFWVSGNELIIKVYPIDNFIYNQCTGGNEANYQYLKLKILNY